MKMLFPLPLPPFPTGVQHTQMNNFLLRTDVKSHWEMWERVGETDRQTDIQTNRHTDRLTDMQTAKCILRKHYVGTMFSAGHNYSQGSQKLHETVNGTIWMYYCKVSLSDHGYWELMVLAHREAVGKEVK